MCRDKSRSFRTWPGRHAGLRGECGTRGRACNPLPGGFGSSARPALRPVCEEHRCTVAGRFAGNARLKAPAREARNWSWVVAFGRLSQSRGGTPIDVRTPMGARPGPQARSNSCCVCRRFASEFLSFVLSRSSLPDKVDRRTTSLRSSMPGNPCRSGACKCFHRHLPAAVQHGPPRQARW